jgi:hypothetical protein
VEDEALLAQRSVPTLPPRLVVLAL